MKDKVEYVDKALEKAMSVLNPIQKAVDVMSEFEKIDFSNIDKSLKEPLKYLAKLETDVETGVSVLSSAVDFVNDYQRRNRSVVISVDRYNEIVSRTINGDVGEFVFIANRREYWHLFKGNLKCSLDEFMNRDEVVMRDYPIIMCVYTICG